MMSKTKILCLLMKLMEAPAVETSQERHWERKRNQRELLMLSVIMLCSSWFAAVADSVLMGNISLSGYRKGPVIEETRLKT